MKTTLLLIVLFLCLAVMEVKGQEDSKNWKLYQGKIITEHKDLFRDMIIDRSPLSKTVDTIIYLWDRYSKECYADSSQHEYNVYVRNGKKYYSPIMEDEIDLGIDPAYRGTEKVWIHKQPYFEDFILWLKKQRGIK